MARIAVVNDDPAFLAMMHDLLADEGHQVVTETAGESAFALIRAQRPDLAVIDLRLEHPEGGWMVLDRMRLDPETAGIPAIICSGDTRTLETEAEHLREEGACILPKPFAVDELLALIAQALDPEAQACGRRPAPLPPHRPS